MSDELRWQFDLAWAMEDCGVAEGRAVFRQDATVHASLRDAGVRGGDVIISFDGQAVEGMVGDLLGGPP